MAQGQWKGVLIECPRCGAEKPYREFSRDGAHGFAPIMCVDCVRRERETTGTKQCRVCGETKPLDDFHKDTRRVDGLTDECRPCKKKMARTQHVLRTYGVTQEQYDALYAAQEGVCAICGSDGRAMVADNDLRGRAPRHMPLLFVDHDHATNTTRGLLCNDCNIGLGMFRDNPIILRTAIAYLKNHHKAEAS